MTLKLKIVKSVLATTILLSTASLWAEEVKQPLSQSKQTDGKDLKLSGIDLQYFDQSVSVKDDFYQHVNGKWLKETVIPSDQSDWGSFKILREKSVKDLHNIIEELSAKQWNQGSNEQKIADLYASFIDENKIETLGIQPIQAEINRVDALKSKQEIVDLAAQYTKIRVNNFLNIGVGQDLKNTKEMAVFIVQNGLAMPDRDYYLLNDEKFKQIRREYLAYIQKTLNLAGDEKAIQNAKEILNLETQLAKIQLSNVENRDYEKLYHKYKIDDLKSLSTHIDLKKYLQELGYTDKVQNVIVLQPSYVKNLDAIFQSTSLDIWKAYFKFHLINDYSPYLSSKFVENHFEFNSHILNGIKEQKPRWKKGMLFVEENIGESLGQAYVNKHFSPEKKQRMEQMVQNLIMSYKERFENSDWLSESTKKEALKKLSTFRVNIGYPNKWKDYSSLVIQKNELVGNIIRIHQFDFQNDLNKLGNPVDREEWEYTPQTVGAMYRPTMNDITFPAAILQPPFFDMNADDAINYGAIGVVIGHEMTHGFDDQGRQFDKDGNLKDWWTAEDAKRFEERAQVMVNFFDSIQVLPGLNANGSLTLGENIADHGGLQVSFQAFKNATKDAPLLVKDGFTPEQRFFLSYAGVWAGNIRDEQIRLQTKSDPHSLGRWRVNGALPQIGAWYDAFGIKEGDPMYLAPEKRVSIW